MPLATRALPFSARNQLATFTDRLDRSQPAAAPRNLKASISNLLVSSERVNLSYFVQIRIYFVLRQALRRRGAGAMPVARA